MAEGTKKGSDKLTPVLVLASIFLAFAVGVLWQKVSSLESGGTSKTAGTAQVAPTGTNEDQPAAMPTQGKLTDEQAKRIDPVTDSDHIRGSKDAEVFLIEYSDFQCPFCQRFHSTAQQAVDDYGGKVAWVYRHYPLDQLHPNARPSAEASECVAELGGNEAWWRFADYALTDGTDLTDLSGMAAEAGVDTGAFQSCYDSGKFANLVESQLQSGIKAGVTGTPGNLVVNKNGEAWLIPGALPLEQVKATIDQALGA